MWCVLFCLSRCVQLLSTHREVLIQEVLERNWIPRLLDWLNLTELPAVQVCRLVVQELAGRWELCSGSVDASWRLLALYRCRWRRCGR